MREMKYEVGEIFEYVSNLDGELLSVEIIGKDVHTGVYDIRTYQSYGDHGSFWRNGETSEYVMDEVYNRSTKLWKVLA